MKMPTEKIDMIMFAPCGMNCKVCYKHCYHKKPCAGCLNSDNGRIVGTSSFCESRFSQFNGWGEIISIYLLPDYMGRGFGKALFDSVIIKLEKMGYRNIFLWVLEENLRARIVCNSLETERQENQYYGGTVLCGIKAD